MEISLPLTLYLLLSTLNRIEEERLKYEKMKEVGVPQSVVDHAAARYARLKLLHLKCVLSEEFCRRFERTDMEEPITLPGAIKRWFYSYYPVVVLFTEDFQEGLVLTEEEAEKVSKWVKEEREKDEPPALA